MRRAANTAVLALGLLLSCSDPGPATDAADTFAPDRRHQALDHPADGTPRAALLERGAGHAGLGQDVAQFTDF
jgi:hypothetical protein